MNTGLQDAANLGWKLAAVVKGQAPDSLLDTYQAERHPVGKAVLRSSGGGLVRLARAHNPALRALRATVTALINTAAPARTRALAQITGIGYRYPAPRGAHPLTGTRVPDVTLAGDRRLYQALRGGRFVLITPPTVRLPTTPSRTTGTARRPAVEHWAGDRRTAVLVRPDGYVAWAADDARTADLEAALTARFPTAG